MQLWELRAEHRSVPGVNYAIVTKSDGLRGVEIRNEIGEQTVIANNEPGTEQ